MENNEQKGNINKSFLAMVFIVLIVVIVGGVILLFTNSDNGEANQNNTNLKDSGLVNYRDSDAGISFDYPSNFSLKEEDENIPEGNLINIYLTNQSEQSHLISVRVYENSAGLSVEDFLINQMENSVVLLLYMITTKDLSLYEQSDYIINSKTIQEFISKETGQKTLFYSKNDLIIMVDCVQVSGEDTVYDVILESLTII